MRSDITTTSIDARPEGVSAPRAHRRRALAGLAITAALALGAAAGCAGDDPGEGNAAVDTDAAVETTTTTAFTPPERVVIEEWQPQRWMEDLSPQIGDLPLSQLRIPGTHDAGSASIPREAPVLSPAQRDAGTEQFEGMPLERVADYVLTQSMGLTEQLDQGIRYLDLRLTCDPDGMFIVHVFRGAPIDDAIGEVAAWAEAHPREVLFLDVQKDYGCADQTYDVDGEATTGVDAFTDLVRRSFGERLAPRPDDADAAVTLDSLVEAGTNVVTYFIDLPYAESTPEYWLRTSGELPPGAGMVNVWQPLTQMPEMFSYLVAQGPTFAGRGDAQMVLGALTTSPMFPRDTGIRNCYEAALEGRCVQTLRQFLEQDVLPAMPVMVTAAADAGYNVISTDFPELGDWPGGRSFAELVVATNRPG